MDNSNDNVQNLVATFFKQLMENSADKKISTPEYIAKLKLLQESLAEKNPFKIGDILCWKAGLKNRSKPEYNQPVIVVEILPAPIYNEKDEFHSAYYREPSDIILGVLVNDEFFTFHYDSRRFNYFQHR